MNLDCCFGIFIYENIPHCRTQPTNHNQLKKIHHSALHCFTFQTIWPPKRLNYKINTPAAPQTDTLKGKSHISNPRARPLTLSAPPQPMLTPVFFLSLFFNKLCHGRAMQGSNEPGSTQPALQRAIREACRMHANHCIQMCNYKGNDKPAPEGPHH